MEPRSTTNSSPNADGYIGDSAQADTRRRFGRRAVIAAGATVLTGVALHRGESAAFATTGSPDESSLAVQQLAVRHGNTLPALNASFHPPNRPLSHIFNGRSHPLREYFSSLADAQAYYPHATSLADESDWAALQAAVNSVTSSGRGWGTLRTDWEQFGTAIIEVPVDADIQINRPVVKGAHLNRNLVIRSATPWGARIEYTGGDGGRILDFERDGVGSVLGIQNMVLWKGGIRIRAPFRGDLRIGDGLMIVDTPHPAVLLEDSPTHGGVGVVFPTISGFHIEHCAGGIHQLSSTATMTTIERGRFLFMSGIPLKVDTVDLIARDLDFQGVREDLARSGAFPYVHITAEHAACAHVELSNIRFGSEKSTMPSGDHFAPPKEFVVLGPTKGPSADQIHNVRLKDVAFRTNGPTATMARAAIMMNARVSALSVENCAFEAFRDCLVDEAYAAVHGAPQGELNQWGNNAVHPVHRAALFSAGGVGWAASNGRTTVVEEVADAAVFDGDNKISALLSAWTTRNCRVDAPVAGGPNGVAYYPVRKTADVAFLARSFGAVAGRSYCVGLLARRGTGRTIELVVQQGGATLARQQSIHLDDEWLLYWIRVPKVTKSGRATVRIYIDRNDGSTSSVHMVTPFVTEGSSPRPPRLNLQLLARSDPPKPAQISVYLADGKSWNPLRRKSGRPYLVFFDGSGYRAVSGA